MRFHLILFLILAAASVVSAQTTTARDFTQLKEQQAKAVAAALEPVNRRYQVALEAILRRATQANDLATANSVNDELKSIGAASGVAVPAKGIVSAEGLEKRLIGTKWFWFGNETIVFMADGKAQWKETQGLWPWKVKNNGLRVIEGENLNNKSKWTITFDRDLKTGTLTGDGSRVIRRIE